MRTQLQGELRRAYSETGVAVLFVTHDLEEAALLSDRVVVIGGSPGRIMDEFRSISGRTVTPTRAVRRRLPRNRPRLHLALQGRGAKHRDSQDVNRYG